jgi:CheY-like chemotaxis protein
MRQQISTVVLIAEDPFIASFVRTLLHRNGYEVVSAGAERGVELIEAGELRADLVITNTPEVFLPVADRVRLLYLAAMPDPSLIAGFPSAIALRKPFCNDELIEAVQFLAVVT